MNSLWLWTNFTQTIKRREPKQSLLYKAAYKEVGFNREYLEVKHT